MIRASKQLKLLYSFSKANIPFDFKLPTPQKIKIVSEFAQQGKQKEKNKKVNVFKMKRQGKAQKLTVKQKNYDNEFESETQVEKLYKKQFYQQLDKGRKTREYYNYQLERGEDLIDDVPVDPYYSYKNADFQNLVQDRKADFERFKTGKFPAQQNKLQIYRKLVDGYETSKHRYEFQEFKKYLEQYPGSLKGSHPSDDPESFAKYARKKIPPHVQAMIAEINKTTLKQNQTENSTQFTHNICDLMAEDRPELSDVQSLQEHIQSQFLSKKQGIIAKYNDVPLVPEVQYEDWNSYIKKLQLWWHFTDIYNNMQQKELLQRAEQMLDLVGTRYIQRYGEYFQIKPKIHSLYIYYRTLPKQVRERAEVRTVFLGLQYCQPDYTYEEKEQALNQAAYMSMPFDLVSTRMMEDLTRKKKYHLTPHLTDRIFNIHPQFTWDINEFLQEVKDEKLRSMSTVKEKETSFPEPPELHKISEGHLANLPIDYYDNDDGFWDEHIQKKLNTYYENQKLSRKQKKYFIH